MCSSDQGRTVLIEKRIGSGGTELDRREIIGIYAGEKKSGGRLERHHVSHRQIAKVATEGKANTELISPVSV